MLPVEYVRGQYHVQYVLRVPHAVMSDVRMMYQVGRGSMALLTRRCFVDSCWMRVAFVRGVKGFLCLGRLCCCGICSKKTITSANSSNWINCYSPSLIQLLRFQYFVQYIYQYILIFFGRDTAGPDTDQLCVWNTDIYDYNTNATLYCSFACGVLVDASK